MGISNSTHVMSDGTQVNTQVVWHHFFMEKGLELTKEKIRDERDMVVGFDTEWSFVKMDDRVEEGDVIFVGVHIKEDLIKLKEKFGIQVRNAGELSELAAKVRGQSRLVAYGPRDLAREILKLRVDQRPQDVIWDFPAPLKNQNVECATTDVYLICQTGKELLGM